MLKLHDELLSEIEERRRLQRELQGKLRAANAALGVCPLGAGESAPTPPVHAPKPKPVAAPAPKPVAAEKPAPARPTPAPTSPPPDPPAPAASEILNIVFVAAEQKPYATTGGLGDVMAALPRALARRGHRVMTVIPRYQEYADGWETGVRCTFDIAGQSCEGGGDGWEGGSL